MITRRGLLSTLAAGALVGSGGIVLADAPETSPRPPRRGMQPVAVPPSAESLIAAAKLGSAAISYVVMDAQTGAVLEAHEPGIGLPPASVAKAVTALYALERLGQGFRYRTRVLATGPVQDGIVQGDLILVGDGDPTLQTDQLGDLVAALAARGVRGVRGRFLTWDGALPYLPQISDEQPVQVGYNPALGGLNLNFNRVHFEWRRTGGEWGVSMDARGARFVPAVRMARMRIVSRETPIFSYETIMTPEANSGQAGAREEWTVAKSALGKGGSRWLPVRHPASYAGEVFQTLAAAQGIKLPDPVAATGQPAGQKPAGQELAVIESDSLAVILRDMLRYSTNITAEAVGLRASGAADLLASGQAMTAWAQARFGVSSTWVDHSGLGAQSRVTTADMAQILIRARSAAAGLQPLLRNQGLRDAKGEEIKNSPVRVMAKSGTLNFVSGLAGHVIPPPGQVPKRRELIFAVAMGDLPQRDGLAMAERESPPGGQAWTKRARNLQHQLIARWSGVYG